MKQVRLFVSAAALLISGMLWANNPAFSWTGGGLNNHPNYLTHHRAHASLAIDTYGYFDIRVWVDGVLINRRPRAYVEITSLRAGHRVVEVEVFGQRGSRMIANTMYIQPHRWNLVEVQRHPHRGWLALNALYTKPLGHYYVSGRRTSVRVYNPRSNWQQGQRPGNFRAAHPHRPGQGDVQNNNGRKYQQKGGRSNNRGGSSRPQNNSDERKSRGHGSRSGG